MKDEDGHVILEPRNFTTKNPKKGKLDSVLFEKPDYVTVGDPFKNRVQDKVLRTEVPEGHKPLHDHNFKPAKTVKVSMNSAYEHMCDRVDVKKNYRDADGAVITAPRNFYTC